MNRTTKLVFGGVLLLVLLLAAAALFRPRRVLYPVPSPNAYEDFLQAAAILPTQAPDFSSHDALKAFVSDSSQSYRLVASGLKRGCAVPVQVSKRWTAQHTGQELPRLKRLTQALLAKAKLAELEGRTSDALESQVVAYRFTEQIGHGGLSPDFLYSMSCRALVLRSYQTLGPYVTSQQKREVFMLVRAAEAGQDKPAAVAERTRRWQFATFGFRGQMDEWRDALQIAWQSRSWAPLASHVSVLSRKKALYEQTYLAPFYRQFGAPSDGGEIGTQQDRAEIRSQPVRPDPKPASAAAVSGR